jgi:hypothetical protein
LLLNSVAYRVCHGWYVRWLNPVGQRGKNGSDDWNLIDASGADPQECFFRSAITATAPQAIAELGPRVARLQDPLDPVPALDDPPISIQDSNDVAVILRRLIAVGSFQSIQRTHIQLVPTHAHLSAEKAAVEGGSEAGAPVLGLITLALHSESELRRFRISAPMRCR